MSSLLNILSIVKQFAFKTDEYLNIKGVRIEYSKNTIRAIATNGCIMCVLDFTEFNNINNLPDGKYTISLDSVKKIEKILKADKNADISKDINIINDDFPKYEQAMIQDFIIKNERGYFNPICYFNPIYLEIIGSVCKNFAKAFNCPKEVKIDFNGSRKETRYTIDNYNCKMLCLIAPL